MRLSGNTCLHLKLAIPFQEGTRIHGKKRKIHGLDTSVVPQGSVRISVKVGSLCHHGMARPQDADGGDGLQLFKVAENVLNKHIGH
jgi:hypothetical protein